MTAMSSFQESTKRLGALVLECAVEVMDFLDGFHGLIHS